MITPRCRLPTLCLSLLLKREVYVTLYIHNTDMPKMVMYVVLSDNSCVVLGRGGPPSARSCCVNPTQELPDLYLGFHLKPIK